MEMNDAEKQFVESARAHGHYTKEGIPFATNAAYDKAIAAIRVLRTSPDRGQSFFMTCLSDPDPSVVKWAAIRLLSDKQHEAVKALERVARGDDLVAFGAEMTLEEWRAGRLKLE
jgi:hypothetical protein